jgi:hypothetical protein
MASALRSAPRLQASSRMRSHDVSLTLQPAAFVRGLPQTERSGLSLREDELSRSTTDFNVSPSRSATFRPRPKGDRHINGDLHIGSNISIGSQRAVALGSIVV